MHRTRPLGPLLLLPLLLLVAACGDDDGDTAASITATPPADTVQAQTLAGNPTDCVTSYDPNVDYFPEKVAPKHAQDWQVRYEKNYKVVSVSGARVGGGGPVSETYVLVQCGTPAPKLEGDLKGAYTFQVPAKTIVDGGGGILAAIEMLGVTDRLTGWRSKLSGIEYLPQIDARSKAGTIADIGPYGSSLETLVALDPDVFTMYESAEDFDRHRKAGIPILYYSPFTEDPLGSAEQLKFVALLFNKERLANETFAPIEARYLDLKAKAEAATPKPTVLIGQINNDGTFGSGRFNPIRLPAALVRDAGGVDVLERFTTGGQSYTSMSLEQAVDAGADADFWFHQAYTPKENTAREFIAARPLSDKFSALEQGNAFHRFSRGEDFFSTGAIRVDELLADMVSILHPELLPGRQLMFLKRIPAQ